MYLQIDIEERSKKAAARKRKENGKKEEEIAAIDAQKKNHRSLEKNEGKEKVV